MMVRSPGWLLERCLGGPSSSERLEEDESESYSESDSERVGRGLEVLGSVRVEAPRGCE